jgi:hypothetical protein
MSSIFLKRHDVGYIFFVANLFVFGILVDSGIAFTGNWLPVVLDIDCRHPA